VTTGTGLATSDLVRVFVADGLEIDGRCAAVEIMRARDSERQSFVSHAFVPDFGSARPLKWARHYSKIQLDTGDFVYVGNVPEKSYNELRKIGTRQNDIGSDGVEFVIEQIINSISGEPNIRVGRPFGWNGFALNDPGLLSTTLGPNGRYLGLHYDDFEGFALRSREKARNRICINLGDAQRGFSFWPVQMKGAFKAIEGSALSSVSSLEVARQIMSKEVIFELVTITLNPGEFYVAPTENILHDGNTSLSRLVDLSLTIRAYISFESIEANEIIGFQAVRSLCANAQIPKLLSRR
jgi:hypothetical protein